MSFLKNFVAGAAGTGQKLFAEQALMDRRAEIQSARDARMEELELKKMEDTAQYRSDTLALREREVDLKAQGDPTNLERQVGFLIEAGVASNAKEAYEKLKNPDKDGQVVALFRGMMDDKEASFGEDTRSAAEIWEEAHKYVYGKEEKAPAPAAASSEEESLPELGDPKDTPVVKAADLVNDPNSDALIQEMYRSGKLTRDQAEKLIDEVDALREKDNKVGGAAPRMLNPVA